MTAYVWAISGYVYSKTHDGGFCLPCVLFATRASNRGCTFGVLVDTPFKDLKKAKGTKHGILPLHEQNEYHKTAMLRADSFALQESDPNMRIRVRKHRRMYTVLWKTRNCITWASRRCYCRL